MKTQLSHLLIAAIVAFVLAETGPLLANGGAFFVPASRGHVDLVYFARIKDARTGRPIQKVPYVTIVDPNSGIYVPFTGDAAGHFRSPDIGALIKEVTTQPIDTKLMEVVVTAAGYKTLKVAAIPRRTKGTVELNIKMEPKPHAEDQAASAPAAAASEPGQPGSGPSAPVDSSKPTFFLLGMCFSLAAIAAVARRSDRRESTGH
jgi:hypothetical protein